MSKPATVANLDGAIRLCRERTLRSICFRRAGERLSEIGRKRLRIMEELLFAERRRIQDCKPGCLIYPEAQFVCTHGCLCYHFSEQHQKFFLTHFELARSDGGLSKEEPNRRAAVGYANVEPYGWVSDLAARIAAILARWKLDAFELSCMSEAWKKQERTLTYKIKGIEPPGLTSEKMAPRACVYHDTTASDQITLHAGLPYWSSLNRFVVVREQIENPYTRAILAGEAMCRLGWELSTVDCHGRFSRCNPVYRWDEHSLCVDSWGTALLQEGEAVLDTMTAGVDRAPSRERTRHFVTASLLHHDVLGDDRRLALIHSELMLRLSLALVMQAGMIARLPEIGISESNSRCLQLRLLHKYALLARFAEGSSQYLGICHREYNDTAIEDLMLYIPRGRWKLYDVIKSLWQFGNSTSTIVDCVQPAPEGAEDWSCAKDQLIRMAAEILGVGQGMRS